MSENSVIINKIPSPTWSWLKMNASSLEIDGAFSEILPEERNLSDEIRKSRSVSGLSKTELYEKLSSSAGKGVEELSENACGSPVVYTIEKKVSRPVVLSFCASDKTRAVSHVVLHALEGAEATVIFLFGSDINDSGFIVSRTVSVLERNARLHVVKAQILGSGFTYVDDTSFACGENASASVSLVSLGASSAYSAVNAALSSYKSSFSLDMGYFCAKGQKLDMNHVVNHFGKKSDCMMRVKGTLCDEAFKTYRGTIDFKNGCAGSTGDEQEETLILSPSCVNNSIPVILCDEEDVSGEHGASIGRISDEVLFYMQTRGIGKKEAEMILARAKVQSVVSLIQDEDVQQAIEERMSEVFIDE